MEILRKTLKRHEGLSLDPYKDDKGYSTIGYGHKLKGKCPSIHPYEAEELLTKDIYHASDRFMKYKFTHGVTVDIDRARVLIELIFWVGYRGFLRFQKMIIAIEKQDYHLAALELYCSELGKNYSRRTRELAETLWGV